MDLHANAVLTVRQRQRVCDLAVHAILRRHGRSRLRVRAVRDEVVRYERARAG